MALREFATAKYIPMLTVSVAEMRALEELPERDKDLLLPYFQLRPWGVSKELENTINRISDAYGDRPFIADLCAPTTLDGPPREVHRELEQLRLADNGYGNWCDFIEERAGMIPTLQLSNLAELNRQAERLAALDRGLAVYLPRQTHGRLGDIGAVVAQHTGGGDNVCAILDLGQRGSDLLVAQATTVGLVRTLRQTLPNAAIAISASTFPSDFVDLNSQEIFERSHFNGVVAQLGGEGLLYSDRGSARAERQMGGGGTPAPRVDLAQASEWSFFRDVSGGDRIDGYIRQARAAVASAAWDPNLRVWGVQMIERTAGRDRNAVKSPPSAAAARINIHLHRQLFFDDPLGLYETDDEWSD